MLRRSVALLPQLKAVAPCTRATRGIRTSASIEGRDQQAMGGSCFKMNSLFRVYNSGTFLQFYQSQVQCDILRWRWTLLGDH